MRKAGSSAGAVIEVVAEFIGGYTIEKGKLWMLQTRDGKRTAQAAVRIAVDMVEEGLISKKEAVLRVTGNDKAAPVSPLRIKGNTMKDRNWSSRPARSEKAIEIETLPVLGGLLAVLMPFVSHLIIGVIAGAMTGFSAVVTGVVVGITLLALTPLLHHLPQATLAAVISLRARFVMSLTMNLPMMKMASAITMLMPHGRIKSSNICW